MGDNAPSFCQRVTYGLPQKVTPTVERMILSLETEQRKVALIAPTLLPSRPTIYEVLNRV